MATKNYTLINTETAETVAEFSRKEYAIEGGSDLNATFQVLSPSGKVVFDSTNQAAQVEDKTPTEEKKPTKGYSEVVEYDTGSKFSFPPYADGAEALASAMGVEVQVSRSGYTVTVTGSKTKIKAYVRQLREMWASGYASFKEWKKDPANRKRRAAWYADKPEGLEKMKKSEFKFHAGHCSEFIENLK